MSQNVRKPNILLIHLHNRKRIQFNLSGIYPMLPLGIAYLGAQLEQADSPVELLDLSLPDNFRLDVAEKVRSGGYDLVGLSATLFSLPEAVELTTQIRKAAPATRLILGGPATIFRAEILFAYMPDMDVFVFGEGENVIVPLVEACRDSARWSAIPGIAFRENGIIRRNPPAPPLPMDDLPLPARHLLPRGKYKMHPPFCRFPPITLIETARGCPYGCAFCSLPRIWRARSIDHVWREIQHVQREEGIREIHFIDPTFTADMERARELARKLAPLGLKFTFKTRADLVTPELLSDMKRGGCYMISYGIESLREEEMLYLNKEVKAEAGLRVIQQTKQAGIDVLAYLLVGNPGENFGQVRFTVRRLVDAGCDFALFSGLFPDPATPLTNQAIRQGWMTERQINEFYFRPRPQTTKTTLTGLPARQVRRWVIWSFLSFYFSPRTLWRLLKKSGQGRVLFEFARAGLHLISELFLPRAKV